MVDMPSFYLVNLPHHVLEHLCTKWLHLPDVLRLASTCHALRFLDSPPSIVRSTIGSALTSTSTEEKRPLFVDDALLFLVDLLIKFARSDGHDPSKSKLTRVVENVLFSFHGEDNVKRAWSSDAYLPYLLLHLAQHSSFISTIHDFYAPEKMLRYTWTAMAVALILRRDEIISEWCYVLSSRHGTDRQRSFLSIPYENTSLLHIVPPTIESSRMRERSRLV